MILSLNAPPAAALADAEPPVRPAWPAPAPPPVLPAELAAARIVVLDDEPANLRLMERMLRRAGYSDITVTDDPDVVRARVEGDAAPDLLLLDLHVGGTDGVALMEELRASGAAGDDLPILVYSGDITAEARQRALAGGARDFLGKPFDPAEVVLRIRNHLETRSLHRALQRQNERLEERVRARTAELHRDVRRRRRVERRLRRREALLRSITLRSSDVVCLANVEGRIRVASCSVERVLGIPAGSVRQGTLYDHIHPDDVHAARRMLASAAGDATAQVRADVRVRHADGGWRNHEVVAAGLPEEPGWVVVNSRDVTERKEAEARLRENTDRYRYLVESASDIIYEVDAEGRFGYVNPQAVFTTGWTAEELRGRPYTDLVDEPMREEVRAFYRAQAEARRLDSYLEFPARTRDGALFWVGQNVRLKLDEAGRPAGAQAVARNVTARVETERLKEEFISVVSHEMRTPLTAIRAGLGLLAAGVLERYPERGKQTLDMAVRNADRLVRLINDVLDLERMASGKLHMEARPYSVTEMLTQAADSVRTMAESASLLLVVNPCAGQVVADPDRVGQVLVNLLGNAIKFSPAEGTLWLGAEARGGEVVFSVRDQGRGIPADKLEAVFERFQQVDASDSRRNNGTGLGLAICRAIVEQHGGRIWVESTLGRGSTFHFTLPRHPSVAPAADEPAPADADGRRAA
jgi:PAS domain S-box-containing protein